MATSKGSSLPRQKKETAIIIDQPNMGGIADSPYFGMKGSLTSIVGWDVHSVPGLFVTAQKLKKDSASTITDLVKILPCSDGNIYMFGQTTGNVWKRDSGGTYSLLGTVAPAAGAVGILDAAEYNGKIYYATESRLGQWDFTAAFAGRNDNFATFAVTNATYHPMKILNEVLYIGDGNNVAQVDGSAVFTGNALVLKKPQIITALGSQITDLLIGVSIPNGLTNCHIYRWTTWSISYTTDYVIREPGINAFFTLDADVIVQAGTAGNLYKLNGAVFELIKQVAPNFPTLYSTGKTNIVYYPATAVFQGIPIFGLSNLSGDPAYEGVYAYGSRGALYPDILTLPYPISSGNLSKIVIWSIAVVSNLIFVSWKDTTSGTVYGVDVIDYSNKYSGAFFETRVVKFSRIWLDNFDRIIVNYQSLPANTAINVFYDPNWQGYTQITGSDIKTDTDRNEIIADLNIRAKTIRYKISETASGNSAPTIEDAVILVD